VVAEIQEKAGPNLLTRIQTRDWTTRDGGLTGSWDCERSEHLALGPCGTVPQGRWPLGRVAFYYMAILLSRVRFRF